MTFRDIIALWPSPDALAAEIGAKNETVRKWRWRNSIPADWWGRVIDAAKVHDHNITPDQLMAAIDRQSAPPRSGSEAAA